MSLVFLIILIPLVTATDGDEKQEELAKKMKNNEWGAVLGEHSYDAVKTGRAAQNYRSVVSVPAAISPGETKTVSAGYAVQSTPGIWTVDYELVNETNDTVQVGYDVVKFAVSGNFPHTFSKNYIVLVTLPKMEDAKDGSL